MNEMIYGKPLIALTHCRIIKYMYWLKNINPLTAKLFNLNFHPLEVVSR